MRLSRRFFLGGSVSLITVSARYVQYVQSAPVIWGDGIHDDTDGMEAACNGMPFRTIDSGTVIYDAVDEGSLELIGGIYRLTRSIDIRVARLLISNVTFKFDQLDRFSISAWTPENFVSVTNA